MIVWYHTGPSKSSVALSGLSAFLATSAFLEGQRRIDRPFELRRLASRYLLPWVFWFALFGAFNFVRHQPVLRPNLSFAAGVLYGTSVHLWFLPYAFVALLLIRLVERRIGQQATAHAAFGLCFAVIATHGLWRPFFSEMTPPYAQYMGSSVPLLFGLVASQTLRAPVFQVEATLLLAGMFLMALLPYPAFGVPHVLGCGALVAAVLLNSRYTLNSLQVAFLASLTYGVYLIHPFFLAFLSIVIRQSELIAVLMVVVLSFTASWAIRSFGGRFGKSIT